VFLTSVLAGGLAGRIGGGEAVMKILAIMGMGLLLLLVVFLLVYHLVLTAVMMSGNILNTLVSMLILGFGVICVWGIWLVAFQLYMDTFCDESVVSWEIYTYAAPLCSAICLWTTAIEVWTPWEMAGRLLLNFVVAVLLGVWAWFLYQRRASELAEQGICNKTTAMLLRVITSLVAGMGGWIVFDLFIDRRHGLMAVAWGSFGAVFAAGLVFGVLDVIFQMEFRAFFAHKLQMAGTLVLTLLICLIISQDWFGYDEYLPGKEEIAEMAIYDRDFSNRTNNAQKGEMLKRMHFQDVERIYDYLKYVTENSLGVVEGSNNIDYQNVITKVTLRSGRSYYRRYKVPIDREIFLSLFTSREFLENAYLISEEAMGRIGKLTLAREGSRVSADNPEVAAVIARAYNQDVMEHPETVILGEKRLLVQVLLEERKERSSYAWDGYSLHVYDTMEHTIEALREAGYEKWVEGWKVSEVSAIELSLAGSVNENTSAEDILAAAGKKYGVEIPGELDLEGEYSLGSAQGEKPVPKEGAEIVEADSTEKQLTLRITDPAEIEELLQEISYISNDRKSSLKKDYIRIEVIDREGVARDCYLQEGTLPMKYLIRFVSAFLEERE